MSLVTNVMIQLDDLADKANLAALDDLTRDSTADGHQILRCITDRDPGEFWGGSKYPECGIWAAAFNYLEIDAFLAGIEAMTWHAPKCFRLFIQEQEDDAFGVYLLRGGKLVKVVEGT